MALSCLLLISMRFVGTVPDLLVLIFLWQLSLNMMLNPLSAWAGDCVPDDQKGILGGLLSFAPGVGALAGALVTIPGLAEGNFRLILIASLVCALVLPVLIWGRPKPMSHLLVDRVYLKAGHSETSDSVKASTPTVWRMWLARLLVQIAEATLFAFLFIWLSGLDGRATDHLVARTFAVVLFASVPIAILAGRWSDRAGRPIRPLLLAVIGGVCGLILMALADRALAGMVGYFVFGVSAAVFLALHASQTLRVLPRPRHRGRDLGIFNLTNTIPSLVMPGLTLTIIPIFGFQALFVILAFLSVGAGLLLTPGSKG